MSKLEECKSKPNKELIEFLEKILSEAKSGQLQGIVGVGVGAGNTTMQFWYNSNNLGLMHMLGEIRVLERNYMDRYIALERKPYEEYCE